MRKWSGSKLPLKLSRAIEIATNQVYKDEDFNFSNVIKLKDQIISKEVKIMLEELSMFELNFVSIPFGYFEDVGNE